MWNYNFYVYITTNPANSGLYIGVTNDLTRRLYEHHENKGNPSSFAGKYHCYNLFYYEHHTHIDHAISREKEIKKWRKEKKLELIKSMNPEYRFLNNDVNTD